jgi:hypothetical protein
MKVISGFTEGSKQLKGSLDDWRFSAIGCREIMRQFQEDNLVTDVIISSFNVEDLRDPLPYYEWVEEPLFRFKPYSSSFGASLTI